MRGLASKSKTTWFLASPDDPFIYKCHFETPNVLQLIYVPSSQWNHGITWFINTAYIMYAAEGGSGVWQMFIDTSITQIESVTIAPTIRYI
jgi:hypothetical protein